MISVQTEIESLEERLKQAELGPDPEFFEKHIDDDMVFVVNGQTSKPKTLIVEAHRPGKGQKFTRVEMSDMTIIDQGSAAVVTCQGTYEGPEGTHVLKFMRVWCKKPDGWKIIAGSMI
jgi:hypothetical protein